MNDRDAHDELPELDDEELAMLAAFQAEEHPPASSVARVRDRVLASTAPPPAGRVIRGPWVAAAAVVAAAAAALLLIDFGGDDATVVRRHGVQQAVDTPELIEADRAIAEEEPTTRTRPQPSPPPSQDPIAPIEAASPVEPSPPARKSAAAKEPPAVQPEPPPEPVSSLAAETRLLDRARKAVAGGRPNEALTILREAQSRFPRGVLGQERSALRVVALCDAGRLASGREAAASFVKAHPRSALRARVESACPTE